MAQPGGSNQAVAPEGALLRLSVEATEAPYNTAATIAVEFSVIADKEALPCLHVFCTFLGKVYETGPLSSWSDRAQSAAACTGASLVLIAGSPDNAQNESTEDCCQWAAVKYELILTPFSLPATSCEQFSKESLAFTVVRTTESSADVAQRKEAQTKISRSEGKERMGKKGGASRSAIPSGESRIAEMSVAPLLLLKDGERAQPPEGVQETLARVPGLHSFHVEVKAMTSLLSQELRHLLNPVWILIKDVRGLPLLSQSPQQARHNDNPGVPAEATAAISPSATAVLGATAATAAVPAAPAALSTVHASEIKGARDELQSRGQSLSQTKNPPEAVSQYFARAHAFRTVLETEPKELSSASTANAIRWNAGFLCFWGPSAADQNELKDFIEERRFRVELHQAAESSGRTDISESCSNSTDVRYREKATGRMPTKPQKAAAGTPAKARRQTAKSQRSAINPAESSGPSSTSPPGYVNYLLASPDTTRLRPPLAVASFCLTALSSCMATHLVFCTDVLPFSGHLVGKEGSETFQPRHIKGPEFMESGALMSIEIRLAEPLFKGLQPGASPRPAAFHQEMTTAVMLQLCPFVDIKALICIDAAEREYGNMLSHIQKCANFLKTEVYTNRIGNVSVSVLRLVLQGPRVLQQGDVVERSVPLLLPKQEINRLFLVAPLESRLAKQARQLGEKDKDRCSSVEKLEGNDTKMRFATSGEVEAESLTGFLVEDTRLLYGVIEGCANGCLVDAAKLLFSVMKEEKGSGSRLLYNSCLRFSDRRYSVANLAQIIDLRTPLRELVTCRALFDKNNAAALPVISGLSKLQMATFFSRAADLKCQDLFPTAEELQSISEFVSKQK